jgi:hypothetical protein
MSEMTKSICELLPNEPCDLYGPRHKPGGSQTPLKRYFLDPVLPVLTLLSMSALTVALLVVIVTTVADMDPQLPGSYVSVDPWAGWGGGSTAALYQDQGTYADMAISADLTEDREPWSGSPINDPF